MAIECPRCKTENSSDSKHCIECAAPLSPSEKGPFPETVTLRSSIKDVTSGEIIAKKYKLLEELGKGGMGVVYRAEQVKPIKRNVALKIIKLGMDTTQVVARFEVERQALAVMDHPNIAKIYDGGATETGRPYFVMELVRGEPITEYCDKHKLSTIERLELFQSACHAIQHAHQKGVIHRDLKPSNILVAIQDDHPIPKIIDFGIAKATEHRLTERTLFTEQGQLIGTPEYMSPEQAEMSGLDVDTRTDIYSLGVILYELIVGVLPFDTKTLRSAGFGEIQRIIRETEPPKASTRFNGLGDTKTSIASQRRTDPKSLQKLIKGDLDWITMKAMAKDRTQRYASASELANDVERHLKHEPILAGRPSAAYRLKKYIRRHKVGFAATTLVVTAILIGIAGTSIGLLRAVKAEKMAREQAETAQQVSDFLIELFQVSDPSEARGNTITAREILDKGSERIESELGDQPLIQARLMDTMGRVYQSLGLFNRSLPLLETALNKRQQMLKSEHPDVAESLNNLGILLVAKGDYAKAEDLFRDALSKRRRLLGNDHPDTAMSLNSLGEVLYWKGDHSGAEPFFREALEIRRKIPGDGLLEASNSMNDLAMTLKQLGRYDEAEPLYRESLLIRQRMLGEEHPAVAQSLNNLGMFLYQMFLNKRNDGIEAEQLIRKALEINRKLLGNEHPEVSTNMNNLALVLRDRGDYDQAEALFREVMEIDRKTLGEEHPYVANDLVSLAFILTKKGDLDTAESMYHEALRIKRKTFPDNHWQIATTKLRLGSCLKDLKQYEKAESFMLEAYPIIRDSFGLDHPRTQVAIKDVISLYESWDKPEKAQAYNVLLKNQKPEK